MPEPTHQTPAQPSGPAPPAGDPGRVPDCLPALNVTFGPTTSGDDLSILALTEDEFVLLLETVYVLGASARRPSRANQAQFEAVRDVVIRGAIREVLAGNIHARTTHTAVPHPQNEQPRRSAPNP